jgi:hypothetical protein
LSRVNMDKDRDREDKEELLPAKRESSHEYD